MPAAPSGRGEEPAGVDAGTVRADRIVVCFHVRPRAATSAIVGLHGAAIAVRVTEAPVDGRANAAVARVLAAAVGVAPSAVELVADARSRAERFELRDPDPAGLAARLRNRLERLPGA